METTLPAAIMAADTATRVSPGQFEPARHFYPRVLNAQIHPFVGFFLRMSKERLINRYCHLNPRVKPGALAEILSYSPKSLRWAGADLFHVTTAAGNRRMVVIETNSCPSGNKSMPIPSDDAEQGGYRTLLEHAFLPLVEKRQLDGRLAVIFDKNYVEASGYAAALADLTGEQVLLAPFPDRSEPTTARYDAGTLFVNDPEDGWVPIRAALRYVTQRPWNRIPVKSKTRLLNPVIGCLAGGRNKLIAAKAYELFSGQLWGTGLRILTPETIGSVAKAEVPLWVKRFGGYAVIKVPYSNAGQGVYTIVNQTELDRFMAEEHAYDRFVVQSLIGNSTWSSEGQEGRLYHVGTMPNRHGHIYAADLRLMVAGGPTGFRPLAVYSRRAAEPLPANLDAGEDSWAVLGTNLSEKQNDGGWAAATERLLLMDRRDFNTLGMGPDDLIEAYVQTVLATVAIDQMATTLLTKKGELRSGLFQSLDPDPQLLREIANAHDPAQPARL